MSRDHNDETGGQCNSGYSAGADFRQSLREAGGTGTEKLAAADSAIAIRGMSCSVASRILSPQRGEKSLIDQLLHQAVVVELLGLGLLRLGIFLAALL